MATRSRRRRRGGLPDWFSGTLLTVLGLVLIGALVALKWWAGVSKIEVGSDNCPLRGPPRAIHVVIFDRSDPISGQQAQRIKQLMKQYKDTAPFGYRFDIYTFEGDAKNELKPILVVCSPGRPEEANELIENPVLIRRRFEQTFSAEIDRVVDQLLKEFTLPSSPIIESLRAAAISSFGPLSESSKIPLKVTLFSDMVQHSQLYSHFRSEPDFTTLSKSVVWPSLRPDLRGAETEIYYLLRPEAKRGNGAVIQNHGHQKFWEHLIGGSNGRITQNRADVIQRLVHGVKMEGSVQNRTKRRRLHLCRGRWGCAGCRADASSTKCPTGACSPSSLSSALPVSWG